jgi:hypothetical protein
LPFCLSAKILECTEEGATETFFSMRLSVYIGSKRAHLDVLEFNLSRRVGQKVTRKTDPFFLLATGDAVLRTVPPGNPFDGDLYVFHVEETVNKAATLVLTLISALISGGFGVLLGWLVFG